MDIQSEDDKKTDRSRLNHTINVAFATIKLKNEFEQLKDGKFEDKELYSLICKAKDNLKKDPESGIKIPKRLWPDYYRKIMEINNLWKYNLSDSWRLIYTIESDNVMIVSIVLEWFNHKEYERRFKY